MLLSVCYSPLKALHDLKYEHVVTGTLANNKSLTFTQFLQFTRFHAVEPRYNLCGIVCKVRMCATKIKNQRPIKRKTLEYTVVQELSRE